MVFVPSMEGHGPMSNFVITIRAARPRARERVTYREWREIRCSRFVLSSNSMRGTQSDTDMCRKISRACCDRPVLVFVKILHGDGRHESPSASRLRARWQPWPLV